MGALEALLSRLRRRRQRLTSSADLGIFLDRQASFLSQKGITEFCRVRSGVYWAKLFSEAAFQEALTRATWMSYTPALAMVAELAEGMLRPEAQGREDELRTAIAHRARAVRAAHALPVNVDPGAWAATDGLVGDRLAAAAQAPPRPVHLVPEPMARLIFAALPLHVEIVAKDYDYIFNNLRMNLVRAHDDFEATADPRAIAASLFEQLEVDGATGRSS